MENYTYENMLTGYKDRVMRISLFDIFAMLDAKQLKDGHNKPIDFFGLGLLSLLFFFESMLLRIKKRGVHELALFLREATDGALFDTIEEYEKLSKTIIETFRPPKGKRNCRKFYNYESGEMDRVEYAILKADDWDTTKNVQYYTLDEQGLELVFATKEYFSEFQISISQMMLRKQLEKGEFYGALRQVDEMRISVNTIKDSIYRIKHDIQKNITSEDTYSRYKELIKDINNRLMSEQDEFVELSHFIKETKSYLDTPSGLDEKDQKALELLVRIDNELAHVHYLHSSLLHESIELKTTALDAASESLYYAGITSFNFDAELARKITSVPIPLEGAKTLAKPYSKLKSFETWSPIAVFAPQLRDLSNKDKVETVFIETADEEYLMKHERQKGISEVLFILSKGLKLEAACIEIEDDTNALNKAGESGENIKVKALSVKKLAEYKELGEYLDTREFAETAVILHQMSPVNVREVLDQEEHILHDGVKKYFSEYAFIYAKEGSEYVELGEHYEIRDVFLWTGGKHE